MNNEKNMAEMKKGQYGIVNGLDTTDEGIMKKLMSMGVFPGMQVKMIQTFPSYVFQIGYTQVAVDKTIATVISVNV